MNRSWLFARVFAGTLLALAGATPAGAIAYKVAFADANRVGTTVTNYGALGNNFISRSASLEYPLGTGYEHLVNGGLWIGARATDELGSFTGVTTGTLDIAQGGSLALATEFTPSGDNILRRSSDGGSPWYDPTATSELDLIGLFDDATVKTTTGNPEAHRPLGLSVRMVSHQWTQPDRADFVIERFMIRNTGAFPLTDVHVGICAQLASGPKSAYVSWPPSSVGSIYGTWYRKKLLAWDGPERLLREHRCAASPVPDACQFEVTPAWMGMQLLTPPDAGQQVTVAVWNWGPGAKGRNEDSERYAILSAGTIADVTAPEYAPGTGDPVELLAVGPFPLLAPGDSIEVAFALVGGADEAAILRNAEVAQKVRDIGYSNPLVSAEDLPVGGQLRLAPTSNPLPRGACSVMLEIPSTPSAGTLSSRLEVIDVSGRMLATRDVGSLGPGRHVVRLEEVATAAPGIYFLRLTSGVDVAKSRIVILP